MCNVPGLPMRCLTAFVMVLALQPAAAFADGGGDAAAAAAEQSSEALADRELDNASSYSALPSGGVGVASADESFGNVVTSPTSKLGLAVGWNDVACGVPTTFTVQAPGATDQCQYRLNSVDRYQTKSQYIEWVMDPSKFAYQDSPEFEVTFCASGLYKLRFSVFERGVTPMFYETVDAWITIDDPAYPSPEAVADQVAAECLDAGNATDFDKALWLHDWVIDHMEYDHTYTYCGAEGAFSRGLGTCESYHRAYTMLLERVGISTGRITGNGHVWTAVKMGGAWYQVDPTWDDAEQYAGYPDLRHLYFGLNDNIMGLAHSDHATVAGYESNSLENNYYIKTGKISEWSDPVAADIEQALAAGKTDFAIKTKHPAWPAAYKDVIDNLVAYDLSARSWSFDDGKAGATLSVTYQDDVYTVAVTDRWPHSIADSAVEVSGIASSYAFTGSVIRPVPTVRRHGELLREGVDYRVSYGGNVAVGKGSVTLQGLGKYQGSRTVSFDIVAGSVQVGAANTWKTVGGKTYYYGADCRAVKWSQKISGSWYYFNGSGVMQTGWVTWNADGSKSYFDPRTGKAVVGWRQFGGVRYYFEPSTGKSVRWSRWIDGSLFYFNGSGVMQTGWVTWNADGSKSYFGSSGKALTGWATISGRRYYFDPATGRSLRWSRKVDGSWYYFDSSSRMVTGLVQWADGTKSYYDAEGRETAGWVYTARSWYYFEPMTGKSVRWSRRINGAWYYFDSLSRMVTGWVVWGDGTKSYFDPSTGRALTGVCWVSGKWYRFDPLTGIAK